MESKANPAGFVASVMSKLVHKSDQTKPDTAFRAIMSKADNPAFESNAWEYLIPFCNIQNDFERIPFALVGAAVAKIGVQSNGKSNIGKAFMNICENQADIEREKRRFRRLIACNSTLEICSILRPILPYLAAKEKSDIDYIRLLKDLLYWNINIRECWATEFYMHSVMNTEEESQS